MGVSRRRRVMAVAALVLLPLGSAGCGDADEPAEDPNRVSAEEATTKARERVQAYLDAMVAKDTTAGRSQLCVPAHAAFDAAATGANGDFADHFTVSAAEITDVRPGPQGQEVSTSVTVTVGKQSTSKPLLFTVTRSGVDWCIAAEAPGGRTPTPGASPAVTP